MDIESLDIDETRHSDLPIRPDGFIGIDLVTAVVPIMSSLCNWLFVLVIIAVSWFLWLKSLSWFSGVPNLFSWFTLVVFIYWILRSTLHVLEARNRSYKWDEIGLHLREGVFTKIEAVIPKDRMQRVSTSKGVWQRLLDYGSVSVFTAGSQLNVIRIKNTRSSEMRRLRTLVLEVIEQRN